MNCAAARELMLEVDLVELEGATESELSRHVRACAQCGAAVRHVLAAERELGRALGSAAPCRSVEQAIGRARRAPQHRWARRAVPLAAAATIASVILLSREGHSPQPPTSRPVATTPPLEVEVPPGQTAAVMATGDPDIIVIWFY